VGLSPPSPERQKSARRPVPSTMLTTTRQEETIEKLRKRREKILNRKARWDIDPTGGVEEGGTGRGQKSDLDYNAILRHADQKWQEYNATL